MPSTCPRRGGPKPLPKIGGRDLPLNDPGGFYGRGLEWERAVALVRRLQAGTRAEELAEAVAVRKRQGG